MNNKYIKKTANSNNNILKNAKIIEGNYIKYFNVEGKVLIEKIDYHSKVVRFYQKIYYNNKNYYIKRWWDYFMDANCFVL